MTLKKRPTDKCMTQVAMDKANNRRFGLVVGARPLEIATPEFTVRSIQQSTPVVSMTNTMTVSLRANYHLRWGSSITIFALSGSTTASTAALAISPSDENGRLPTTAG